MYYKSLVECLKSIGYLYLPGIGSLYVHKGTSRLDEYNYIIHPQLHNLILLEDESIEFEAQLNYLSDLWNTDMIHTRAALNKLSSEISSTCAKNEVFGFPGLGTFRNNFNVIKFESSNQLELSYHYFNQEVEINKAFVLGKNEIEPDEINTFNEAAVIAMSNDDHIDDKNDYVVLRPKYYKLAAACLLFMCISIFGLSVWDGAVDTFVKPVSYNLDSSEYSMDQVNRSPETDGSEENIDKILDNNLAETVVIDTIAVIDMNESEIAENIITDSADLEECIYILGSFSNEKNARKMKRRIEDLQLKVYKAPFNGNTRIGVLIPCSDVEGLHKLKSLEENYWLLN